MRGSRYKGIVGLILIFCLFVNSTVFAQVPAPTTVGFTGRLNVAINQLIGKRLAKYGFAANDPRFKATSDGVGGGLTVLGGVAIAGGTAVSWPALLTAAGISGLIVGGVSLAQNSDYKWTWDGSSSITAGGSTPGSAYNFSPLLLPGNAPLVKGQEAFYYQHTNSEGVTGKVWASNPTALTNYATGTNSSRCSYTTLGGSGYWGWACQYMVNGIWLNYYPNTGISPYDSGTGAYVDDAPPVSPVVYNPVRYSVSDATKAIPASLRQSAVTAEILAAAANTSWKAALPSFESGGVPWPASDPITPAEVQEWMNANPSSVPNVGDFASPANWATSSGSISVGSGGMPSGGGSGTSPTNPTNPTDPGTQPGTDPWIEPETPPVTPGKGTEINWGPNPNIGAPNLESTPTAKSILDPVFDLMPSLKSFTAPSHQSVCPTGSFSAFGKQYLISSHCNMFEENRSVIAGSMALVFAIASLVIVLRA